MEQNQPRTEPQIEETVAETATVIAPKMGMLLKEGWGFAKERTDLLKWYILILAIMSVFSSSYLLEMGGIMTYVATIGIFVTAIFLAMNSWAILYVVSQPDEVGVSYHDAFAWSSGHFFPLLWTSFLSGLATVFGMVLFLIPGIALSVYLYFSVYAYAMGSDYGLPALKQSYHDVKGRWWPVAIKLVQLSLWLLLLYLLPLIIYSLAFTFFEEGGWEFMLIDVLVQGVFAGVVGVMTMYAVSEYYKHLRLTKA